MNLKQLKYFIAVAEELHFGRAADRLFISQPALSFDIKKLEEQLDTQLLLRNNKSVQLTAAGETLLAEAKDLLIRVEQIKQLTVRAANGAMGQLRVGFVSTILYCGLPKALKSFQKIHPNIEITMFEMNSEEQLKALEQGKIDIGFVHSSKPLEGINSELLISDYFVCCLPTNHRLAQKETAINLQELSSENFILFPRQVSPYYYDLIISKCISAGFSPFIKHEAKLWQTIISMISLGMGVTLVPKMLSNIFIDDVHYVDLTKKSFVSETHVVYSNTSPSSLVYEFLDEMKKAIEPLQTVSS